MAGIAVAGTGEHQGRVLDALKPRAPWVRCVPDGDLLAGSEVLRVLEEVDEHRARRDQPANREGRPAEGPVAAISHQHVAARKGRQDDQARPSKGRVRVQPQPEDGARCGPPGMPAPSSRLGRLAIAPQGGQQQDQEPDHHQADHRRAEPDSRQGQMPIAESGQRGRGQTGQGAAGPGKHQVTEQEDPGHDGRADDRRDEPQGPRLVTEGPHAEALQVDEQALAAVVVRVPQPFVSGVDRLARVDAVQRLVEVQARRRLPQVIHADRQRGGENSDAGKGDYGGSSSV